MVYLLRTHTFVFHIIIIGTIRLNAKAGIYTVSKSPAQARDANLVSRLFVFNFKGPTTVSVDAFINIT